MKKQICIYIVTNMVNSKQYVGKTIDFKKRKNAHYNDTLHESNLYFHKALRKYNKNDFKWVFIEYPIEELDYWEKYWISVLNTKNKGYNLTEGGEGVLGRIVSQQEKIDKSEQFKGKTWEELRGKEKSEEERERRKIFWTGSGNPNYGNHKLAGKNNPNFGKSLTEETKEKMSIAAKKRFENKINHPMYGKKRPDISEKMKGENNPMFGKTGEQNPMFGKPSAMKGKKHKEESIQLMRNKKKEYWENRRII